VVKFSLGGALTDFPCKLRLNFFLRPGSTGAPTALLGTPMDRRQT